MIKIGLSTFAFQTQYGDKEAIRLAKKVGADAIDLNVGSYDYRNKDSIYSKSEEEFVAYFTDLKNYADSIGLEICQTHGRLPGFRSDKDIREIIPMLT